MPKIKAASVAFDSTADVTSSGTDHSDTDSVCPVVIYFGSQSGTAEAFSSIIHKELQTIGIPSEIEDLDKFEPKSFSAHKLVILVVATTGEGDATDNAKKFNKYITSKATPIDVFKNLNYTVFGLGDLNYINFNQMGKRTEINMDRLGAKKIYPRGIGDASQDIEADLRRWIDGGLIDAIKESVPSLRRTGSKPVVVLHGIPDLLEMINVSESSSVRPSSPPVTDPTVHGRDILSKVFWTLKSATVLRNAELRPSPSLTESTKKLTLQIDSQYTACDSIEILPRNSPESVAEVASLFKISNLDQMIDFKDPSGTRVQKLPFPTPCTIREALTQYVDLSCAPSRTFISNMAVLVRTADPELEEALHAFANSQSLMKLVSRTDNYRFNFINFFKLFKLFFPAIDGAFSIGDYLQISQKQRLRPYTGASNDSDSRVDLIVSLTAEKLEHSVTGVQTFIREMISESIVPPHCLGWKNVAEIGRQFLGESEYHFGLCSRFLSQIKENDQMLYRVRESVLRPPPEGVPETVVAICTGAGVAPALAYIERITAVPGGWSKLRNFHLVFGCRRRDSDYLLTEIHPAVRVHPAFSRESDKKRYVQDVVKEETEMHKILANLNEKSRVVICGSTAMCRAVCEVIANQIGGQAQLERLEKAGIVLVEYFG